MRQVPCRKCWQPTSLLARRCARCGDADKIRFVKGISELSFYIAGSASMIGLAVWFAITYF